MPKQKRTKTDSEHLASAAAVERRWQTVEELSAFVARWRQAQLDAPARVLLSATVTLSQLHPDKE